MTTSERRGPLTLPERRAQPHEAVRDRVERILLGRPRPGPVPGGDMAAEAGPL